MTDDSEIVAPSRIHAEKDSVVQWGSDGFRYEPDLSVVEGEMQTLDFSQNPDQTIGTKGVYDCVTLIAHDGEKASLFHIWRSKFYYEELKDTVTIDEIRQGYQRQGRALLANVRDNLDLIAQEFDPQKTTITIIGGNTNKDNMVIKNSGRMVKLLDAQLEKLGFSVHHKDLFGDDGLTRPGRYVVAEANGNIHVKGPVEHAYTVNIHEIAAKGPVAPDVSFSQDRTNPPSDIDASTNYTPPIDRQENGFSFRADLEECQVKARVKQAFADAERKGIVMINPKTAASVSASINSMSVGAQAVQIDQERLTQIVDGEVVPSPNEVRAIALRLGDSDLLGLLKGAERMTD